MINQTIIAGFGGQGILYMGDLLAEAGLNEGRFATYMPTYGAAVRGGTANCVVTLADEEIGSPMLENPHTAIFMNTQSLKQFQNKIRIGGVIVANSSLIHHDSYERGDNIQILWIPAMDIAKNIAGNDRFANMAALGALLSIQPLVQPASIEALILRHKTGEKDGINAKNLAVFHEGLKSTR